MTSDIRLERRADAAGTSVVPAELARIQAFLNSVDIEAGTDRFDTPERLRAWLVERGLPGAEVLLAERERRGLVEIREAIRAVVAAHGAAVPSDARETLATAASSASLIVTIDRAGQADLLPTGHGPDALVARLLADVATAQRIGTWRDLRICRRGTCQWAFYDASRNHSGVWCSMSICGNREKSANLRRRRSGVTGRNARR